MRCRNCGYDNLPEARFCANCGQELLAAEPVASLMEEVKAATEERLDYAGFWRRLAAALIDALVVGGWFSIIEPLRFLLNESTLVAFFPFIVVILYYWLLTGFKGQTLGKMALGIKVINAGGSKPGLGRAALREIPGKIISTFIIFLGFFWIAWDEDKRGWHDLIAGTLVIKKVTRGKEG